MRAIDTTLDVTPHLHWLREEGIIAVGRYYSRNGWKVLRPAEAAAVSRAGLNLFVVYQDRQDRLVDFSRAAGRSAAYHALAQAHDSIRQPAGSAIYFAVDFDTDEAAIGARIAPYFDGVLGVFADGGHGLTVGVYGNRLVCRALLDAGLARYAWLRHPSGGTGDCLRVDDGDWAIIQKEARSTPFPHDLCELAANPDGYGGFAVT